MIFSAVSRTWMSTLVRLGGQSSAHHRHLPADEQKISARAGMTSARFWTKDQSKLALLIYAAVFMNTLTFVLLVSDPLLTQDSWYFLDVFVRHAYDGQLGLGDLFVQRSGFDHAEPLRKLILLMELKWFRLSLLPQAVIGLFCAGGCAYLLHRLIRQEADKSSWGIEVPLMGLTIGCALISLNSTGVWTWSLVALGYTSLIFVFWFFIAIWRACNSGRYLEVMIASALLAFVSDDTAILAGAAALLAVLGFGWKKSLRNGWWRVPALFIAIIAIEQILVGVFGPVTAADTVGEGGAKGGILLHTFFQEGWWKWPVYALSNSAISKDMLNWLAPTHVLRCQVVLAGILGCLHLWFWWGFLRRKAAGTAFVAVCLMLLYYAFVAGIIYGRVSDYGSDYLNQPRYVLLYQLNLVALALMYVGGRPQQRTDWSRPAWARLRPGIVFTLAFLVLQPVFAKHAWHTAPYIRLYYWNMAEQTLALAKHPEITPKGCVPELPICDMAPAKRAELLALLQQHNLNLFNDKFRLMHGFQPDVQSDP